MPGYVAIESIAIATRTNNATSGLASLDATNAAGG
jgi:hypothetical protein